MKNGEKYGDVNDGSTIGGIGRRGKLEKTSEKITSVPLIERLILH